MTKVLARDPARRCLPLHEWPEIDRRIWEAALQPGDLLDDGGARARYAPASNRKLAKGYGRWLSWLTWVGQLDPITAPATRITPARVAAYVGDLERFNGSHTLLARLQELHDMATVIDPGQDWGWIRRIAARVRARHAPVRQKRARLVGADELFALGFQLMAAAPSAGTGRQQAITYRDGLIIALLAARTLGRTVMMRGADWWITVPAAETKTGSPIEAPLPAQLGPALASYLAVHRPLLAGLSGRWAAPVGEALWISSDGSPMSAQALYDRIVERTDTAFDRSIHPHLFRDCAATTIAIEAPQHVRIAAQLLGHRSGATTERHYNQAQALEAARLAQGFILSLRRGKMDGRARSGGKP